MSFLKKIKNSLKKNWEIVVGFFILLIGIFVGTSGKREKVLENDIKSQSKANKKIQKETYEAIDNYQTKQEKNLSDKKEKENKADETEKERKEELKDSEKLGKVLDEKYGLKGD